MRDDKYVVFKRAEWETFEETLGQWIPRPGTQPIPSELEDAVVIRTGDVFAPAGLHAYAHLVHFCIELANFDPAIKKQLETTRDYFLERAYEADERFRRRACKYPD